MEIKPIKGSLDFERIRKYYFKWTESGTSNDESIVEALQILPGIAGVVGGLIVLGWQIYTWLYSGIWISPSAYVVLVEIFGPPSSFDWLATPESWLGLHRLLFWCVVQLYTMHLGWFFVLVGFTLVGMMIPVRIVIDAITGKI